MTGPPPGGPVGSARPHWADRTLGRAAAAIRRPTVVVGALVATVALVRTLPVAALEDLGFSDDNAYLRLGVFFRVEPPTGAQGPVFAAWYWAAAHVFDTRVQAQFATYLAFGAALGLVVYALAVALGARRTPAALAALVLTGSAVPVVRPTVGTFTAVVLWGTVALAWRWRRRPAFWPVVTVGAALATWARPEFLVGLVGIVVLAVVAVFVGPGAADRRSAALAAAACLLVAAVGWIGFGSPTAGARQWVAFCQHEGYARSVLGDRTVVDPWIEWQRTCRATYGTDTTIAAAAIDHPGAVAAHVGRSLRLLPASVRDAMVDERDGVARVRSGVAAGVGIALLVATGVVVARRRRFLPGVVRSAGLPGVALGVLLVPNVVAIVVIHPRYHYVAVPLVLVLAFAAAAVSRARAPRAAAATVLGCALLAVVIGGTSVWQAAAVRPTRPNLALVAELRRRHALEGLDRVMPLGGDLGGYVPGLRTVVRPADDPQGAFARWLGQRRVDGVLVAANALDWAHRTTDSPVAAFVRNPQRWGWTAVPVGGGTTLVVRDAG